MSDDIWEILHILKVCKLFANYDNLNLSWFTIMQILVYCSGFGSNCAMFMRRFLTTSQTSPSTS